MPTVIHGKLVRDKIPYIIRSKGEIAHVRRLTDFEYRAALKQKLVEEAQEVAATDNHDDFLTEVADVLEVLRALIKAYGISSGRVEKMAKQRAYEQGAFVSQTLLLYTEPKPESTRRFRTKKRAAT